MQYLIFQLIKLFVARVYYNFLPTCIVLEITITLNVYADIIYLI